MSEKIFPDIRPDVVEKFTLAEQLLEDRMGGVSALKEAMTDMVKSYKDQVIDVYFAEEEDITHDPFAILSIYKVMRDAIDLYILNQMKLFELDFTTDEIDYYFRHQLSAWKGTGNGEE